MNREVCIRVRGAARWAAQIASVAIGAAIPMILLRAPATGVSMERRPVPVPVIKPAALSGQPKPPRRIGCTLPVSQIGLAGIDRYDTRPVPELIGVAASATGCTIAVWGHRDVFVSRDDGASFSRLAPASDMSSILPPDSTPVVAVGPYETVYVIRNGRLEIETRDGSVHSAALPDPAFRRIRVSDNWVVVWSHDQIATSPDNGKNWYRIALPAMSAPLTNAAVHIAQDAFHLAVAVGENEPVTYYTSDLGHANWHTVWTSPPTRAHGERHASWRPETVFPSVESFAFGNDGVLYAERRDAAKHSTWYELQVFAVTPSGSATMSIAIANPWVLRGAPIAGPSADREARDAHGLRLALHGGSGPVRMASSLEQLVDPSWGNADKGRWLVGSIVP
jgi:hypothetical protein